MRPNVSEIQDFLIREQKLEEDPIDSKAKYRVTRQMAKSIKENQPLPKGKCHLCGREDDKLFPVTGNACPTCTNKFIQRGGGLRVIRKESKEVYCNFCLVRTFTSFYINPNCCNVCSKRIGAEHKHGHKEMQQDKQKYERIKRQRGVKQ